MTYFNPQYKILTPTRLLTTLITINVFMFIISLIYTGDDIVWSFHPLKTLMPDSDVLEYLGAAGKMPVLKYETWQSLIIANWLHGGLLHIIFNMLALRNIGSMVIEEFGLFRMFSIYTLSGIVGFLFSYFGNVYLTIGASSGLCGLIGALWYYGRSRGGEWGQSIHKQTSGWLLILGIIGFFFPNIDNWCHAGGFLGGILFGWLFCYSEKRKENIFDIILSISLAVLTVFLLARPIITGFISIFL